MTQMSYDNHESRMQMRQKKRKTNLILNTLIAVVFAFILIIGYQLLFQEPKSEKQVQPSDTKQEQSNITEAPTEEEQNNETSVQEEEKDTDEEVIVKEGEDGSGVEKVIENPNWEPIGTVQTGEHVATYDKESTDWGEMVQAISYATNVPEDQMTILWLGNNGSPHDAVGTIQNKQDQQKYRVMITWVDNEGWKPTKVEVLQSE